MPTGHVITLMDILIDHGVGRFVFQEFSLTFPRPPAPLEVLVPPLDEEMPLLPTGLVVLAFLGSAVAVLASLHGTRSG